MRVKSMDVLREKMAKHPRREIAGRSFEGTACLELLTMDGKRPAMLNHAGYARVDDGSDGTVLAHRAALAVATGHDVWSEPLEVDHLCWTRNCCNPAHLEWVTRATNNSSERLSPEGLEVRRSVGRANGSVYGRANLSAHRCANGRASVESGQLAAAQRASVEATKIAVVSRNIDTGELLYHRDQLAAARELGVHQGNISKCVLGKRSRTGRYAFERFDPINPTHAALAKDARK